MIFVTHNYSPKVLQPRKQALDFPASLVTAQFSSVLCFQLFIQRIRVIRFISDYFSRSLVGEAFGNCSLDKFDLVRRSRFCVDGERKTKAVCHCHEFRTLAPLGLSNLEAPFLADTNVPSIKVSDKSSLPRSSKSCAKVSSTFFNLPSLTHSWKRRWQVWY